MPKGFCDPGVGLHNETYTGTSDGGVSVDIIWDWDGVSAYPNCDGPVVSVRTRNNTAGTTYYAHLPHKTKGTTGVTILPGSDTTLTGSQLKQAGLDIYSALLDVVLNQSPT